MTRGRRASGRLVGRSRRNVRRAKRAAVIVGAVKARNAAKVGQTARRRRAAVAVAEMDMKKAKPTRKARARAR